MNSEIKARAPTKVPGTEAMPPIEDLSNAESDEIFVVDSKPKAKAGAKAAPTSPLSHRPRRSTSRAVQDKVIETIEDEVEDYGSEAGGKKLQVRVAVPKPLNREEYEQILDAPQDDTVVKVVDQGGDGRFSIIYADGRGETVSLHFISFLPYAPSPLVRATIIWSCA